MMTNSIFLRILGIAFLISIGLKNVNAQTSNCSFEVNEFDKFTQTKNLRIEQKIVHRLGSIMVVLSFVLNEKSTFIELYISDSHRKYNIYLDQAFIIRTQSGDLYTMYPEYETTHETINVLGTNVTFIKVSYHIPVDDLLYLVEDKITDLRINVDKGELDFSINNKKAKKLRQKLKCFLSEID